ncbi:MAG: signal peptidase II [Candidatus Nanopelagicales bacterium]
MSKLPITLGVAAGVIVLDQVSKVWAVANLEGTAPRPILGSVVSLHFVRNPGAAFSLAGNYTILISLLAFVVSVVIVRTSRTLTSNWWAVVLGGVLGGALGNLIDRMLRAPGPGRGHVVDFLQLPHWPIFNVADMSLVGSAVLAVMLTLRGIELSDEHAPAAPERAAAQDG